MKKYLLVAALASVATGAFGQGQVIFYNRATSGSPAPVVAPVFNVNPANPMEVKNGQPTTSWNGTTSSNTAVGPNPAPAGTQTYAGAPLTGTGFTAAIWGVVDDPNSANDDALLNDKSRAPDFQTGFQVTTRQNLMGFWNNTVATFANVASDPAIHGRFIVRVWDNKGGTLGTWAQALAAFNIGQTAIGESTLFTVNQQLGSGSTAQPTIAGFESFQLHTVPEPSVIALGVLGAGCLFLLRRRK